MIVLLFMACADITPIEDGRQFGPVVVLKDWFTSAALLPTEPGPVLIDAGFREGNMTDALASQGVEPSEIIAVLMTHGHSDHLGALGLYTNASIYALAEEAAIIEEESEGAVTPDIFLSDGEHLVFGQYTIEVFSAPGHTPGNTTYFVDGVLLMGDTAQITRDGQLTPVAEKHSEDPAQAEAALSALAEELEPRREEIEWLVPAHSGAAVGLDPLLEYAGR